MTLLIIINREKREEPLPSSIEVVLVLLMWMLVVVDVVDANSLLEWACLAQQFVVEGGGKSKQRAKDESENQPNNHVIN